MVKKKNKGHHTARQSSGVISRSEVVEGSRSSRVDERVDEPKEGLAVREAMVI